MMRVGASVGLRPWEVYRMTPRELELFIQGQEETWARVRMLMAWAQANLMNAHGGKRKIRPADLLSKEDNERMGQGRQEAPQSLMGMTPKEIGRLFSERSIQRAEAVYRRTPEGKRVQALKKTLGYEEEETDAEG